MGMLPKLSDGIKTYITNIHHMIIDVINGSHRLLIKWLRMHISHCGVWLD